MQLFSGPADRNKEPVFNVISDILLQTGQVLEIGSGTGQHALFFAEKMPHLHWHPSDCGEYLVGLRTRFKMNPVANVAAPVELDVRNLPWNLGGLKSVETIYTANTLHIMGLDAVECFFAGAGQVLEQGGHLIVYGPFKYRGDYTTPSNADFDIWLKNRDRRSGIRDFEAVDALAQNIGLSLRADQDMPANNQCLIWQRK